MTSIFTVIYAIWGLSEILINRLLQSKTTDKRNLDKSSLSLIWIVIVISLTIAVFVSLKYYFPVASSETIKYFGLALILTGVVLRLLIIKSLGKFFTADVTIRQNHKLKTDGFYHLLRHPSYAASLLSFTGFGISLNNWVSLLIVAAAILIAFINRIKVEEKALIEYFGQEYIEYKSQQRD